ncbi:MAG: ABC transporter permease [Candidatus Rokubacteria bacterium]|nr:ABC transporter permease [Candidatus Rokubacteria bacterium]
MNRAFIGIPSTLILIFLLLPIIVIIPISFSSAQYLTFPPPGYSLQWYRRLLDRPEWGRALWVSFRVASLATLASMTLGTLSAFALVRGRFSGKTALYAAILAPMTLPSVIIGLGCYFLFARLNLAGTVWALALGHTVIILPVVVIILSATLQNFDERLEQAAIILGASPLVAFRRVTLPLISSGVISAALFSFLLSFDDLVLSLFLADPSSVTLPIQIWNHTVMKIEPTIAAVSSCLIGVAVIIGLLSRICGAAWSR